MYRQALAHDADLMEQAFADNGWSNAWQDGIFTYHHFHSIAQEVLALHGVRCRLRLVARRVRR